MSKRCAALFWFNPAKCFESAGMQYKEFSDKHRLGHHNVWRKGESYEKVLFESIELGLQIGLIDLGKLMSFLKDLHVINGNHLQFFLEQQEKNLNKLREVIK